MSSETAIRVQDLGKCYQIYQNPRDRLRQFLWRGRRNFFQEFWALRGVSLEVQRGETLGIIGRNGSGKSTLLKMLAGTLTPTSGSIAITGRIAALLELGSGFNPEFTGRENVFLNGAILGIDQKEMGRIFDDIAAFADIGEFIDQPVKTYSSGMVMRLAFAVSVHVQPDVLLIDEALSVGDAAFRFKCLDRLQGLTRNGTTLLFVSHDTGTVKSFCSRVLYLQNGQERAQGTPDEMAELYAMDIRDEQRRSVDKNTRVAAKVALNKNMKMAFGTEEGYITNACFSENKGQYVLCSRGSRVSVSATVRFRDTVQYPCLSLLLQDRRLVELGGRYFPLTGEASDQGWKQDSLILTFPANFMAGRYYITLRLENRISKRMMFPIDKQTGVLELEVNDSENDLLGMMNIHVEREGSGPDTASAAVS